MLDRLRSVSWLPAPVFIVACALLMPAVWIPPVSTGKTSWVQSTIQSTAAKLSVEQGYAEIKRRMPLGRWVDETLHVACTRDFGGREVSASNIVPHCNAGSVGVAPSLFAWTIFGLFSTAAALALMVGMPRASVGRISRLAFAGVTRIGRAAWTQLLLFVPAAVVTWVAFLLRDGQLAKNLPLAFGTTILLRLGMGSLRELWARSNSTFATSIGDVREERSAYLLLRHRARALRTAAWTALAAIFFVALSGILVFAYSGQIAVQDESSRLRSSLERQQQSIEDDRNAARSGLRIQRSRLARMEDEVKSLEDIAGEFRSLSARSVEREYMRRGLDELAPMKRERDSQIRVVAEAEEEIKAQTERLSAIQKRIVDAESHPSTPNWGVFLTALTLRLGVSFILVFLVQILVGAYRYSLRLAAFYDGRADALKLSPNGVNTMPFAEAVRAFGGEKVSFGPDPKAPVEQMTELLKEAGSRAGAARDAVPP
jgi:hypothetical protein